jgi:predicted Zn-dependent protease
MITRRSRVLSYVVRGSPSLLERSTIYLLPIVRGSAGSVWPSWGPDLDSIKSWIEAYFGLVVKVLPPSTVENLKENDDRTIGATEGMIGTFSTPGGDEKHRLKCRYDYQTKHVQISEEDLSPKIKRIFFSQQYIYPGDVKDAAVIIGITCEDLYTPGPQSLFTAGMAYVREKVAVLSFARYHPQIRMSGLRWEDYGYAKTGTDSPYFDDDRTRPTAVTPESAPARLSGTFQTEYFRRAGKLVVHEVCHLFYVNHCVYYHCLMNGTGHLVSAFVNNSSMSSLLTACRLGALVINTRLKTTADQLSSALSVYESCNIVLASTCVGGMSYSELCLRLQV